MITRTDRNSRGFTLTELLVVIVIVGILLTFILVAARDSVRSTMEKATYALVVKLETGLNERLEAVLAERGEVTLAHQHLGSTFLSTYSLDPVTNLPPTYSPQRSAVIAQFDQVRAEVPDVFVKAGAPFDVRYPFNFGGLPFPYNSNAMDNYVLPLGKSLNFDQTNGWTLKNPRDPGSGIFGASYTAAAGVYKNLGYQPTGYNGVDDDGDGYVDDLKEGIGKDAPINNPDDISSGAIKPSALIAARYARHTHNTARAEMLYALLIEGQGPLGSVFARDDFTENEIKDTDGDGLPEFVDAWGEPLRFYRWPIFYSPTATGSAGAYIQKGPYNYSSTEARQTDPLDGNGLLMAPAWWWSKVNANSPPGSNFPAVNDASGGAVAFMYYFHTLLDPHLDWSSGTPPAGQAWDRGSFLRRRAYYSRPLIISSGPDKMLGVPELGVDYRSVVPSTLELGASSDGSGAPLGVSAVNLIQVENLASQYDPNRIGLFGQINWNASVNQTDAFFGGTAGLDDITNQSLSSPGGGVR